MKSLAQRIWLQILMILIGIAPLASVFLAGLILFPAIIVWLGVAEASKPVTTTAGLIAAGLLVGLGTRMANGCTSGHGVCGISRLALRGMVATAVYLVFGVLGVLIARALGWSL